MICFPLTSKTAGRAQGLVSAISFAVLLMPTSANGQSSFPSYGIIHNSLIKDDQTIMLGVTPYGNLNTPDNVGSSANNTLNQSKNSRGRILRQVNPGTVGISYYWAGAQERSQDTGSLSGTLTTFLDGMTLQVLALSGSPGRPAP